MDVGFLQARLASANRRLEEMQRDLDRAQSHGSSSSREGSSPSVAHASSSQPGQPATSRTYHHPDVRNLSATPSVEQAILLASSRGHLEPDQGEPIYARFFSLGATIDPKLKVRIWNGEYIEVGSLTSTTNNPSLTINMSSDNPTLALSTPRSAKPDNIWAWLRLFHTYASIYCEKFPAEGPSIFTYVIRILDLHRRYKGPVWRSYNERFRALRALMPLSWDKIHWDITMELIGDEQTPANTIQSSSITSNKREGGSYPSGCCRKFFDSGRCKYGKECIHEHVCGLCKKCGHFRLQCKPKPKPD